MKMIEVFSWQKSNNLIYWPLNKTYLYLFIYIIKTIKFNQNVWNDTVY